MRDLYVTSARRRQSFGATSFGMRSRFVDEIPVELTDAEPVISRGPGFGRGGGFRGRAVTSWGSAASSAAATEAPPATDFRLGDDVVHGAFGEVLLFFGMARRERSIGAFLSGTGVPKRVP